MWELARGSPLSAALSAAVLAIGAAPPEARDGGDTAWDGGEHAGDAGGKESGSALVTPRRTDLMGPGEVARGSLPKADISAEIHRHRNQIRFCYERELSRRGTSHARVVVKFVIQPDGSVSHATVTPADGGAPELEGCVVNEVRAMQFPRPRGGGGVVVTYPFSFRALDTESSPTPADGGR